MDDVRSLTTVIRVVDDFACTLVLSRGFCVIDPWEEEDGVYNVFVKLSLDNSGSGDKQTHDR